MAIQKNAVQDVNDPVIAPGEHPVGTGIGAGSMAFAGAVAGSALGPIGTATGAIVGGIAGAVVGGLAGKGIAELINPTEVEDYLQKNYSNRPYAANSSYDTYKPAYRYGYEARSRFADKKFDDVESDLRQDWEKNPSNKNLNWGSAKDAVRDSYDYTGDLYQQRLNAKN